MTLEATARRWASFNLREDQFDGLRIGSSIELLPLGGGERIAARVTEIVARGEFATWRAARVDPVAPAAVLQPGMSVWLQSTRPAE